jgi:hypothetical protein
MTAPDTIDRLQAALEDLAVALASGQSDAVLAAEGPLADAVRALDGGTHPDPADALSWRRRVDTVRGLVARCRALGHASGGLLDAMFPPALYGRGGVRQAAHQSGLPLPARTWR